MILGCLVSLSQAVAYRDLSGTELRAEEDLSWQLGKKAAEHGQVCCGQTQQQQLLLSMPNAFQPNLKDFQGANDLSLFLCLWQVFEIQQEENLRTKKVPL